MSAARIFLECHSWELNPPLVLVWSVLEQEHLNCWVSLARSNLIQWGVVSSVVWEILVVCSDRLQLEQQQTLHAWSSAYWIKDSPQSRPLLAETSAAILQWLWPSVKRILRTWTLDFFLSSWQSVLQSLCGQMYMYTYTCNLFARARARVCHVYAHVPRPTAHVPKLCKKNQEL